METLKYKDEQDRCYGLTGMAMSVVILDKEELLAGINLDADSDGMMEFRPQYFFAGNPRLSARLAWNHILDHYRLSMNMLVANVLSRCYVNRREELTAGMLKEMHACLIEEGRDACSLDEDEVNSMFNSEFSYMQRVFRHPGVQQIVRDFAGQLKGRRRMSIQEIMEGMSALGRL